MRQGKEDLQRAGTGPSVRERGLSAFVGIVCAGAGAVAVFITDNEIGTAALLLIGGAFLLCATFGVVPTRLKFGDSEMAVGRAAMNTLERIVSESDLPTQERALETMEGELASQGVRRSSDEAVASMLSRFVRYSDSELPNRIFESLSSAGWTPSTPSKSTYILWTYRGSSQHVTLYQNSAQLLITKNRLVELALGMPGVEHRPSKNEAVVSYASTTDNALAVADRLRAFADGEPASTSPA